MPDARCPHCGGWAPRQQWETAPGQPFPFRIVCPGCGGESDCGDVDYRLSPSAAAPPPPAGIDRVTLC